jgi:hypothetical protein
MIQFIEILKKKIFLLYNMVSYTTRGGTKVTNVKVHSATNTRTGHKMFYILGINAKGKTQSIIVSESTAKQLKGKKSFVAVGSKKSTKAKRMKRLKKATGRCEGKYTKCVSNPRLRLPGKARCGVNYDECLGKIASHVWKLKPKKRRVGSKKAKSKKAKKGKSKKAKK